MQGIGKPRAADCWIITHLPGSLYVLSNSLSKYSASEALPSTSSQATKTGLGTSNSGITTRVAKAIAGNTQLSLVPRQADSAGTVSEVRR